MGGGADRAAAGRGRGGPSGRGVHRVRGYNRRAEDRLMPFVAVEHLNKFYEVGAQRIHVLRDLDLTVEKGEMLAIVGASGVGKSTLLHALGGLDRVDSGSVRIQDHELAAMNDVALVEFRNRNVGFVFQFHHLLPEFDALENVEMPMRIAREPLSAAGERATT